MYSPYMGVVAILVMGPGPFPPYPRRLRVKFGFDWQSDFRVEKMFEHCEQQRRRRRTSEHGYPISSPCEPDGSDELTMK